VPKVDYEAEVARNRALVIEREEREAHIAKLEERIRLLQQEGRTLELERKSLNQERIELIDSIEDLRIGNEELAGELAREREIRQDREAEIRQISGTYSKLVEELEREVEAGNLEIHRLEGRLQVRALDRILFDSGSAHIKPEGKEVLARVAQQLEQIEEHKIHVEGHTDDVPIATERFPSNWELSADRAAVVVRFLIENGLNPAKLRAVGFGEHHPIAPNDTSEHRARNRRIEIVLVPERGE
jgi:chemotaxis protein MotB